MSALPGIAPADIYLPARSVDKAKWAVVACDQFTSQPEYWHNVERCVSSAPSTLRLILPEVFLDDAPARIPAIRASMRQYMANGVLELAVAGGFVLTERETPSGARLGLVAAVDLDAYDYAPGAASLVRATEQTILSRIPPRVKIREGAPLETPHAMLLIDDAMNTVIEPLFAKANELRPLYDFELMEGGGRLRGWAVDAPEDIGALADALNRLNAKSDGLLYAVGDGNHSLATAKACWEAVKAGLPAPETLTHPARCALAEIVNLRSPALIFEPIHRALFNTDGDKLIDAFGEYLRARGMSLMPGSDVRFIFGGRETRLSIAGAGDMLPVAVLQPFLDEYLCAHSEASIDYIHGEAELRALCANGCTTGALLSAIDKRALFPSIRAGGVLPRKTFSMGEAREKRYYMECRRIS